MKALRAALLALLRIVLVLGLASAPLGQPMALAALAAPLQDPAASGCPHHARSAQAAAGPFQVKPGECCHKKGSPCHCAMTVALPASGAPALAASTSDHPVSVPHLVTAILPSPEPPPPRS